MARQHLDQSVDVLVGEKLLGAGKPIERMILNKALQPSPADAQFGSRFGHGVQGSHILNPQLKHYGNRLRRDDQWTPAPCLD